LSGVVGVAAGVAHTCALLGDGSVRCWGGNGSGQIAAPGDGNVRLAPVAIPDLAGATSISAGDYHSCAVLTGGGVKCWGSNGLAQLGTGTTGDPSPPVTALLTGVAEIAVADDFSCARTTSGTVRCWGFAVALGQPNQLDGTQPSTTGLANIVAVTAGGNAACALDGTGAASCWGINLQGQLGTGDQNPRDRATPVKGGTGVATINAGLLHACAVLTDHTVRCWGENAFGALGDGTTKSSLVPVAVRVGPPP
jgi:alpha-tubulin suppressor-like RCC1 family protein